MRNEEWGEETVNYSGRDSERTEGHQLYSCQWLISYSSYRSILSELSNLSNWKWKVCQSSNIIIYFKYIIILASLTDSRNEFDNFDNFDNLHLWIIKILNINQLQGSPMYSKSSSTSFLVKKWSRWWSKNPTFRSSSHSFWSPIIHLRSLRFADSWLKFGENRCARCDFL